MTLIFALEQVHTILQIHLMMLLLSNKESNERRNEKGLWANFNFGYILLISHIDLWMTKIPFKQQRTCHDMNDTPPQARA